MKNKNLTGKAASLAQITLLVISIVAMTYMISESFGIASAGDNCVSDKNCKGTKCIGGTCAEAAKTTAEPEKSNINYQGILSAGVGIYSIFPTIKKLVSPDITKEKLGDAAVNNPVSTSTQTLTNPGKEVLTRSGTGPESMIKANWGTALKSIAQSAGLALAAGLAARYLSGLLGVPRQTAQALGWGAAAGVFAGTQAGNLLGTGTTLSGLVGVNGGVLGAILSPLGVGIIVGLIVFALTLKSESSQTISFECHTWSPATGGKDCTKCNNDLMPCSEYQCRSLGQSCSLINVGTSDQKCVYNNSKDVQPPIIEPLQEVLKQNYKYTPDNTVSPPNRAVKIEYQNSQDKCIPAFSPITFGIQTNEPAKCKIDTKHTNNFDDMIFYFGGDSLLTTKHTQTISMPSKDSLESENITLQNGGNFQVYVRCQDANGNYNSGEFMFKYCVDQGPDVTAPEIVGTNILTDSPISYNQTSINNVELYVTEPVDGCKWSFSDQKYNDMPVQMDCSKAKLLSDMNNLMLYTCKTTLSGLKDRTDNNFYFKCRDKSNNTDEESYKLHLIGTQPLILDKVSPNNTVIKDSTDVIKVKLTAETSAGYKDGAAKCYFSDNNVASSYVLFSNTGSYQHSQNLFLESGNYGYYIKCCDLGNNCDTKKASFTIETDRQAPQVVRIYHESNYLRFITDENSTCVYDAVNCNYNFDDGIKVTSVQGSYGTEQYTDWDTKKEYFIKCKDAFGNQPDPGQCSIIARPFEDLTKKQ